MFLRIFFGYAKMHCSNGWNAWLRPRQVRHFEAPAAAQACISVRDN
ncbi:hypothetical protein ASZ90_001414 [hydrocarbon metagenome]|uniref:Uncharacterized protein n=1 Tax=hydrocarbon metagenome TaxID=938273 RepID=A0A0W8G6T1_9ZZZZ